MAKRQKIVTGIGDDGQTTLASGERISKDAPCLNACGDVDELTSQLGLARCHVKHEETHRAILTIQMSLFDLAAELVTAPGKTLTGVKPIDEERVAILTERCHELESELTLPDGFIVPSDNLASAHLDCARATARRCERKMVGLFREKLLKNKYAVIWMNRLSDYLWLLARFEEQ
ncbi:MAG: cob(I)yrinic acid a,c-diamide adenosyltransferase [Spartobacteria bacterium]|nr:cob(I)yrinic acid a,c-diamide adenosyltransferase [Spartobacteria bacterium]